GAGEDEPRDEILRSAELQSVGTPDREVGSLSWRELADVVASEHRSAASRPQPEGVAHTESLRPAAGSRDQERLLHLEEEIAALVRRGAVDAEPDTDVCVQELAHARNPRAETHVGGRTVRDSDVVFAELRHG